LQKSTPGTAPWRTQGGCALDARTCGVRLVGIVILSRGRSAESSGGGHGRVAARRSQCAQRSWRPVPRCRVATLDPTDVLFGRFARTLPGLLHPRWPNSGWGRERTCGLRHGATRGHGCCVVCRCVRGPFSETAASKRAPRGPRDFWRTAGISTICRSKFDVSAPFSLKMCTLCRRTLAHVATQLNVINAWRCPW